MISSNTYFYFFSTVAQCLAAVTGLVFVAIQMRVSFIDGKLTSAKRVLVSKICGHSNIGLIEFEMNSKEASQLIDSTGTFEGSQKKEIEPFRNELIKQFDAANEIRTNSAKLIQILIFGTILPIAQIPFVEYWGSEKTSIDQKYLIFLINFIFLALIVCNTLNKLSEVLAIKQKRKDWEVNNE